MIALIGQKIGMTQRFNDNAHLIPVTAIRVFPNTVVYKKSTQLEGYNAVVIATANIRSTLLSKPVRGQFESRNLTPHRKLMEVRNYPHECNVGDVLRLDILKDIRFVDVRGLCKGKGFQGVIKRHNFRGGRKTHGSKFHREVGSTGMAATPSRVLKGTKMAGRMPARNVTVQNLTIIDIRTNENDDILLLKGAVPGPNGGWIFISEALKRESSNQTS